MALTAEAKARLKGKDKARYPGSQDTRDFEISRFLTHGDFVSSQS